MFMLYSYLELWENLWKFIYVQADGFLKAFLSTQIHLCTLKRSLVLPSDSFQRICSVRCVPAQLASGSKNKRSGFPKEQKTTLHNIVILYIWISGSFLKRGKLCAWMLVCREIMKGIFITKLCQTYPCVIFTNPNACYFFTVEYVFKES